MLLSAVVLATLAQATPIVGDHARIRGSLFNPGERDFYSFAAQAGDVVYAATQTSFSAGDGNTVLAIVDASGTVVESDDDDGSYALYASSLAGTVLPARGTYYLRVSGATPASTARPYDLYFQLRRGVPGYETEPNDDFLNPQPLPAGGWVGGQINYTGDDDVYGFTANAGDTIFISVDLRGETRLPRTRIMMGIFEGYLTSAEHGLTSQAMAFTVKNTGSYEVALDTGQGPYVLSVTAFPAADASACTTLSTLVNGAIPALGSVSGTLEVPDDMILDDVDVLVGLDADIYQDIGIRVASPQGTSVGLVQKISVNAPNAISATFDDAAAVPINWTEFYNAPVFQPQRSYRLHWLDGESSLGTWTITVDVNPNQGTYGT
ncbi:MAG TPA: hypothetical protein VIA18_31730, partial [Polyangia bacterium]|nr:hypothetical protein [Polyangia bacterium]